MHLDGARPTLFDDHDLPQPDWERTDDEIACALELNTLNTFRTQFRRLRTRFHSFRAMMDAPPESLTGIPGWAESWRKLFVEQRAQLSIGRGLGKVPKDTRIVTYFDSDFPPVLRELYSPPPVLYVKGELSYDFAASLSIVGSRVYSEYGRRTAEQFAYQLTSWGFTIVSGGARGIDSLAHKGALAAGGRTIAVFGCGIDVVFPAENRKLFQQIAESGALVSEFPVGTVPEKFNFPSRNRLIAALGRGTLVVEAAEKSGALITADLALQNGREVFAVPGRLIDGQSRGTNKLIQDGAHLVLDPSDVPLRFGLILLHRESSAADRPMEQLRGDEALVYEAVGLEAKCSDALVREVGIPAPRVLSALLILQTRGLVRELPGSRFVKPIAPAQPVEKRGPQQDSEEEV